MNLHVIGTNQIQYLLLDRSYHRINYRFFVFHIRWHGSRNLSAYIQCILQLSNVISISDTPSSVQEKQQKHQCNHPQHDQQKHDIQHFRLLLQCQIPTFQLLVLTGIIKNIQIYVPVIIRLRLHSQCRISHTQLFTETGNPFGYRPNPLLVDPLQFHRMGSHRHIRFQTVDRVMTMVIFLVMEVYIRKCFR